MPLPHAKGKSLVPAALKWLQCFAISKNHPVQLFLVPPRDKQRWLIKATWPQICSLDDAYTRPGTFLGN